MLLPAAERPGPSALSNSPVDAESDDSSTQKGRKIHRQKFTEEEDSFLMFYVSKFGTDNWSMVARNMINRSARQCRDRWNHYLCPYANKIEWTPEQEQLLIDQIRKVGHKWSYLTAMFPGHTSIGIRNHYKRMMLDRGIKNVSKTEFYPSEDDSDGKNESEAQKIIEPKSEIHKMLLPSCTSLLLSSGSINGIGRMGGLFQI